MSRLLIETIKCSNGRLQNLSYHQNRFNLVRKELFGVTELISLDSAIQIHESAFVGLFRCRVLYSKEIEKIEFLPHTYRPVNSLKLVEDNRIDYHLKYADRERLTQLFHERSNCDDILIVKNGCITDSYTANPIFYDGATWWTPDTPLLPGTQRARLLEEGKIKGCRITPGDLMKYTKVGLINAMQDLESMPVIPISEIKV